jgi:molecular chaperone GrpE
MSTDKTPENMAAGPARTAPAAVTPDDLLSPEAANPDMAPSATKHVDDVIADLRREVSDYKDKYLRAHADMDNLRKRTEREKEDTAKYAVTRLARDLLGLGDNFQRALAAVPTGAADADPALKSLVDGITITEREFHGVLDKHGVKRIDALGEPFNPHLHQAVMEMPTPDGPAGIVVQVFQSGYVIEDRTLRPAMVAVSTSGSVPAASPASDIDPAATA